MATLPFRVEEKRRFPRLQLAGAPLKYQVRGSPESRNAQCDDISIGGMCFVNDNFLPSATSLMLEVNILSRVLCFIGKVAWASPLAHSDRYRIGVGFEESAPQPDKDFLSDYIDMQLGRII